MRFAIPFKWLTKVLAAFSILSLSTVALAKDINMYDQPNQSSKVIGTIDLSTGVIPIFTPKGGEWVKIGDPRNGNVGWVKASDIANGSSSSFSFTQKIITEENKEPQIQSYKIQIGNTPPDIKLDKHTTEMIKQMQMQQKVIQQSAKQVMQEMIDNINRLYKQQPELLHNNGTFPVIMPIVIVPASALKPESTPQPATPAAKK